MPNILGVERRLLAAAAVARRWRCPRRQVLPGPGVEVVDTGPHDLAFTVDRPAVCPGDPGDQVQAEAALRRVAADGRAGRSVGRGVADLEQPGRADGGDGD